MMNGTMAQSEPEIDFFKLRGREKDKVVRWSDTYSDPVCNFSSPLCPPSVHPLPRNRS
jgi:hypothetical protein